MSEIINLRLRDFKLFAKSYLKISPKVGAPFPFVLNRAQNYIHDRLQKQLDDVGKVRALILKGRQQGVSTLTQARFFWKVITKRNTRAYILTHESEATKNLFNMTMRFYENMPPGLCPIADKSSSKELIFKNLGSGYSVGTAGNRGAGRSQTLQLFHGSETAFWPHAEEHVRGVLNAISDQEGTEIILESTANGIGNYFHGMWKSAEKGDTEYQAIFVPWYWQEEYTVSDKGISLTDDEEFIYELYKHDGMTKKHLAWRRTKISASKDIEAGVESFKQEYPCSATEAFLNPVENIFINSRFVDKARKNRIDSDNRLIIGVDVAIGDTDKTAIIRRKGRVAYNLETFRGLNTMEIAGMLKHVIEREKPHRVYIDCIGVGAGVVDRLREHNFHFVEGINVARTANAKDKYRNVRAELWAEMRDWLYQDMPVQIPDDDVLHGELCCLGYRFDSSGRLLIESKDDLKARGIASPDCADALALTFFSGFYDTTTETNNVTIIPTHRPNMFI